MARTGGRFLSDPPTQPQTENPDLPRQAGPLIPTRQLATCNQAVRRNSGPAGAVSGPFVTAEAAAIVTAADEIVGVDAGLFPGLFVGRLLCLCRGAHLDAPR